MDLRRRKACWKTGLLLGPEFQVIKGLPVMGHESQNGVCLSLLFLEDPHKAPGITAHWVLLIEPFCTMCPSPHEVSEPGTNTGVASYGQAFPGWAITWQVMSCHLLMSTFWVSKYDHRGIPTWAPSNASRLLHEVYELGPAGHRTEQSHNTEDWPMFLC